MRRNQTLLTIRQKGENTTFSRVLPYALITLLIIILCSRLDESGYRPYLFRILTSVTILSLVGGLGGVLMTRFLDFDFLGRYYSRAKFLGYTMGAAWAAYHWETILLYLTGIKTGSLDPVLGKDIGFYLFDLPFYESLFWLLFCLTAVNLGRLFIQLFVQGDRGYRYNRIYIHIGLLLFVLAWGRYIERYDQLYWQLGSNFDMDCAGGTVLLPSVGRIIVAVVTGSFFVLFPFVRSRLPVLPVLSRLSTRRPGNPHFRLIRCVLAIAMVMMWQTGSQTSQLPVEPASAANLPLPFSRAGQIIRVWDPDSSEQACLITEFESGPDPDSPVAVP